MSQDTVSPKWTAELLPTGGLGLAFEELEVQLSSASVQWLFLLQLSPANHALFLLKFF
jgi:hypothetical protein